MVLPVLLVTVSVGEGTTLIVAMVVSEAEQVLLPVPLDKILKEALLVRTPIVNVSVEPVPARLAPIAALVLLSLN